MHDARSRTPSGPVPEPARPHWESIEGLFVGSNEKSSGNKAQSLSNLHASQLSRQKDGVVDAAQFVTRSFVETLSGGVFLINKKTD